MALGKNIRKFRTELGLSQDQLSVLTGGTVSQGAITALEVRDSSKSEHAPAIAKAFGVSIDELLAGIRFTDESGNELNVSHRDLRREIENKISSEKQNKNYPLVVGTARMGDKGYYLDLEGGNGHVEFEAEVGSIAIHVRGDSMHPAIRDGWYVVIEPSGTPTTGEYVLLNFLDGRHMVKELLMIKPDCYVVMSVNSGGRFTVMKDELQDIRAISAVVPPSKHKE